VGGKRIDGDDHGDTTGQSFDRRSEKSLRRARSHDDAEHRERKPPTQNERERDEERGGDKHAFCPSHVGGADSDGGAWPPDLELVVGRENERKEDVGRRWASPSRNKPARPIHESTVLPRRTARIVRGNDLRATQIILDADRDHRCSR
jgi:hypothetical protein